MADKQGSLKIDAAASAAAPEWWFFVTKFDR
jgi:hypothetical protein